MKWILACYLYNDLLIMQCNYCVCENRDMDGDLCCSRLFAASLY